MPHPPSLVRTPAILALSVALHVGAFVAIASLPRPPGPDRPAPARIIPVTLVEPDLRQPAPPPTPGRPLGARPRTGKPQRTGAPTAQPRQVPERAPGLPTDEPKGLDPAEASDAASTVPPGSGGSKDGALGGIAGGEAGGRFVPGPPEPVPARPADLASVRSGIARTLVYPPGARREGLQGRVLVAFVVLADGRIRDLTVREGCGHEVLDAAALRAIEEAAPFTPPGVDVRVVLPLNFRIN